MLISLNWLKQYIDLEGIEINELENALTMIGQEVEKIDRQGSNVVRVCRASVNLARNCADFHLVFELFL